MGQGMGQGTVLCLIYTGVTKGSGMAETWTDIMYTAQSANIKSLGE